MDILTLNMQEWFALDGLSHFCQSLYTMALKPYINPQDVTIGGSSNRISLQSLREHLYIKPRCGRQNTGYPSKDQVRRGLETLERERIIERIPDNRYLIYQCVLADSLTMKNSISSEISPNAEIAVIPIKINGMENSAGQNYFPC